MSFISYAQNYEDVMLWRALSGIEGGFYIDVGAWSPDLDSVTRAFYERGWSGINVEPNPIFHDKICSRRPRDVNLKLAVADHEGVLTINLLDNPGLSSLDDAIAAKHQAAGARVCRQEVQVTTLASIWAQHVRDEQVVHFLKIDVEGFEEAALRGNDWCKYRPWVVVVEATLPMSQVECHDAWEHILLKAEYQFVYADGLNRFYVALEHSELFATFEYPPNVFDGFMLAAHQEAEVNANQAKARAIQAEVNASQAEARAIQAEVNASQAEARAIQAEVALDQAFTQIQAVYKSTSWRITAPLRSAGRVGWDFTSFFQQAARSSSISNVQLRSGFMAIIRQVGRYVHASPQIKRLILRVCSWSPWLAFKFRRFYLESQLPHHKHQADWFGRVTPKADVQAAGYAGQNTDGAFTAPPRDGINAQQRSPLEAHYHTYGGRE